MAKVKVVDGRVVMPPLTRTVRIPIENFAAYEAELGREIRQQVFGKSMPQAGKAVRLLLEKVTIDREIFFRKRFARSWRAVIGAQPSSVRVFNKQPYASVIEFGRRKGAKAPPVAALLPWVIGKLGIPRENARSVAFLIARKISERGIPARPILRDPDVQAEIQRVVTDAVNVKLIKAINKTKVRR